MLENIPKCRAVMTAGEKAALTLISLTGSSLPEVGGFVEFDYAGRRIRHYRMPSTSHAYPQPLPEKAEVYRKMFSELGMAPEGLR